MSNTSSLIANIKSEVLNLVSKNQSLKNEVIDLQEQISSLTLKAKTKDETIAKLEEEINAIKAQKDEKLVNSGLANNTVVTEKEISKMIKEIDECLTLLNI